MDRIDIDDLLERVVAPKFRPAVIDWVLSHHPNIDGYCISEVEFKDIPFASRAEVAQKLRKAWMRADSRHYIHVPENNKQVAHLIAQRYAFDSFDILREVDSDVAGLIAEAVNHHTWYDDYICNQEYDAKELSRIANTLNKKLIEPKLTEQKMAKLEERRKQYQPPADTYPDHELRPKIAEFLKENWLKSHTYNQVATALNAKWRQVSRLLDEMVASDKTTVKYTHQHGRLKGKPLYKFSPWRKKVDAAPHEIDCVVQKLILHFMKRDQEKTTRDLCKKVTAAMGSVWRTVIERNLVVLVEEGKIQRRRGGKNAWLYSLI